jgi:chemotaxis protein CheD
VTPRAAGDELRAGGRPRPHPAASESPRAEGGREPHRVPRGRTYVRPGDLVVATQPDVLFTVLGSCVSVCLWHAERKIAGMNHFVFPGRGDATQRGPRFGSDAVAGLLERMLGAGAEPSRTVAKVFGGARIPEVRADHLSISSENVRVALDLLGAAGVHVAASDLGGHRGRKVLFDTATGDVWMKYLVESGDERD